MKAIEDTFIQERALKGFLRDCKPPNFASWRPDSWAAAHLWRVEVCGEGGPGLAVRRLAAGGVIIHHSAGTWAGRVTRGRGTLGSARCRWAHWTMLRHRPTEERTLLVNFEE